MRGKETLKKINNKGEITMTKEKLFKLDVGEMYYLGLVHKLHEAKTEEEKAAIQEEMDAMLKEDYLK